jgi:hypothetical protein
VLIAAVNKTLGGWECSAWSTAVECCRLFYAALQSGSCSEDPDTGPCCSQHSMLVGITSCSALHARFGGAAKHTLCLCFVRDCMPMRTVHSSMEAMGTLHEPYMRVGGRKSGRWWPWTLVFSCLATWYCRSLILHAAVLGIVNQCVGVASELACVSGAPWLAGLSRDTGAL